MPAVYDKMGIRFVYPDNWVLDDQQALEGEQAVSVHSPGGAFWSITLHPATIEPKELAATALAALKQEYPDSEAEPVDDVIAGVATSGFDLNFFYLDFTNTALIRAFRTPTSSCLVLCQAEDREYAQMGKVFEAITTSLLSAK